MPFSLQNTVKNDRTFNNAMTTMLINPTFLPLATDEHR